MDNEPNVPKGFGGLSDLASRVEIPAAPPVSAPQPQTSESPRSNAHVTLPIRPPSLDRKSESKPSRFLAADKWIVGGALAVVGLVYLFGGSRSREAPSSRSDTAASMKPPPPAPVWTSIPVESTPPLGTGLTLSNDQIRYCLSQKIRLTEWNQHVNQYSTTSVSSFNAGVEDYNARCGDFRYRTGTLENVRSEVEGRRLQLQAEARARASLTP